MGFSNLLGGGGDQAAGAAPATGDASATPAARPDFGQRLGNYFESRYPIAGGLANAVFGDSKQQASVAGTAPASAVAPLAAMPSPRQPDYSILAMNAQPQQRGGGLAALLKFLA